MTPRPLVRKKTTADLFPTAGGFQQTMDDTSAPRFEYRSDLSGTPLPEVLLTIHKYRVPGTIDCSRDEERKSIYIDQGNIIFATSSETSDSLGDRLLAKGVISQQQYDESVSRLQAPGNRKRQGTILVEMGALQPRELFVSVLDQVQAIVWSVFEWETGAVTFAPGRDKHTEFIKLSIPTPEAVLEGVRHRGDPKRLLGRIGKRTTVVERTSGRPPEDLSLEPSEMEFLESVDGKKTLADIVAAGPVPPPQAARLLYAFFILGLLRHREPTKVQFRTVGRKYKP